MVGCNKRLLFGVVFSVVIILSGVYLGFAVGVFPIIRISDENECVNNSTSLDCAVTDSIIKPFENIEFNKMVLVLDFDDYDSSCVFPESIPHRKVLWNSDTCMVNSLKNTMWHTEGGDICTVASKLLLLKDNQLVKSYEILLESNMVGIQSQETGWIEAVENEETLSIFAEFSICRKLLLCIN
ncbi:MAG: hypothetical protein II453_16800 [Alphaproteobacteria bacterium]|nr:hypothetical protein [Alphaproteobacteria bacterium]